MSNLYSFSCPYCHYQQNFLLGYPDDTYAEKLIKEIKAGKQGNLAKTIVEQDDDFPINSWSILVQCVQCHHLETVINLTMDSTNKIKEGPYRRIRLNPIYKCSKCHSTARPWNRKKSLICPQCGKRLLNFHEGMEFFP